MQVCIVWGSRLRCYGFEGLAPGRYYVEVLKDNFVIGSGNLAGCASLPGVQTGDDDAGEDGIDDLQPEFNGIISAAVEVLVDQAPETADGETGKDSTSDDANDDNTDLTIDFGFKEGKVDLYTNWKTDQFGVTTTNVDPGENFDSDLHSNLIEYAFCLDPITGTGNPMCLEPRTGGGYDLVFHRRLGSLSDITYCILDIEDLALSPAGWDETELGSLPGTTPVTVTPQVDGISEEVRIANVQNLLTGGATRGFFVLAAKLDCNNDGTDDVIDYTDVHGFQMTTIESDECETYTCPFLMKPVFSGKVDGVSSLNLDFGTTSGVGLDFTPGSGGILESGESYYIEVLDGTLKGHRFDISTGSSETLTLASDASVPAGPIHSTMTTNTGVPAGMNGAQVMVVKHISLAEKAPKDAFDDAGTQAAADAVLIPDAVTNMWAEYWLFTNGGSPHWTIKGDATMSSKDSTVIPPCQGIFMHPKNSAVTLESYGMVRENSFACPLVEGYNLISTGYPMELTPAEMELDTSVISGTQDPEQSDQILLWDRDGVSASDSDTYTRYWFVDHDTFEKWVLTGDLTLAPKDTSDVFSTDRAAYLKMTTDQLGYKVATQPWTMMTPFDNGNCN